MLRPALIAIVWLLPPPVLPVPSRTGAEGPPRSFGAEPPLEVAAPAPTARALLRAQNRALLDGPFPRDGLTRGVSDGALFLSEDPSVRGSAMTLIHSAGASVVRIPVNWRNTIVEDPPPGFDASDPASPAYHFGHVDAAVADAVAAGLTPLLVVSHAPAFAEAPDRWSYAYLGSWAPSPVALQAFAAALARRYDGSFPDPLTLGRMLPRVRLLQAWNEPNLARYLEPQWVAENGRWRAFSPLLYRELLNGFYAGVKSVAPDDLVLTAGVAPNGDPEGVGRMAPVRFLRAMLCLPRVLASSAHPRSKRSVRLHAKHAAAVSAHPPCPNPPHFDVLAFHPLSVGNPDLPAPSSLDVSISDAAKITGLLRQAERLRTALPAGSAKPVWVTELNWESAPQTPHGVPPRLQAQWISRALHRLWVAGVGAAQWQFLIDPFPGVRAGTATGGTFEYSRPAGLYSAGAGGAPALAQPKQFLRGFSFPFDPLRVSARRVRVWALLSRSGQPALLQRQSYRLHDRAWRTVAQLRANRFGVINTLVSLKGFARLRLTTSGALGSGGSSSSVVVVSRRRTRL